MVPLVGGDAAQLVTSGPVLVAAAAGVGFAAVFTSRGLLFGAIGRGWSITSGCW